MEKLKIVAYIRAPGACEVLHQAAERILADVMFCSGPEDFAENLREFDDAIGIFHCGSSLVGQSMILAMREEGIRNRLFVLFFESAISRRVAFPGLLRAGADQVQPYPIDPAELAAFIWALRRRDSNPQDDVVTHGELTINIAAGSVTISGSPVYLTGREFQILSALARSPGRLVTKAGLLSALYDGRDEPEMKIIDVFVCKIRKKLGFEHGRLIETVWGRGYRFGPEVESGVDV